MIFNKIRTVMFLAAMAGTVLFTACTYTDPAGRDHSLRPYEAPTRPGDTNPAKWVNLGCFTDNGETYCMIDTNGDGKVDLIKRMRDGKLMQPQDPFDVNPTWLTPPATKPTDPPVPSNPTTRPSGAFTATLGTGEGGSSDFTESDDGGRSAFRAMVSGLFLDNDRANPTAPFNFSGQTAAQWIESFGLNTPAGVQVNLDNIRLDSFDTDTHHTAVTIYWSSNFIMPDITRDDRAVNYTLYSLEGAPKQPNFVVMRLEGDVADVLSIMVEMGTQEFSFDGSVGEHWSVQAQPGKATLFLEGSGFTSITLP